MRSQAYKQNGKKKSQEIKESENFGTPGIVTVNGQARRSAIRIQTPSR